MKDPYLFNSTQNQRNRDYEKNLGESNAALSKLGFFETKTDQRKYDSGVEPVIEAYTSPKYFDSVLIVRVACPTGLAGISTPVKFTDIQWNLLDKNIKTKNRSGSIQSDSNGMAKIQFRTQGTIATKKIDLKVKSTNKEFILNVGPYEILLNEKDCSKN